jgi:hypothetical protein
MRSDFFRRHQISRLAKKPVLLLLLIVIIGTFFLYPMVNDGFRWQEETSYGSADILLANYEKWKSNRKALGDDGKLVLALGPIRGLSKKFLNARGSLSLNLFDGSLNVEVDGLPDTGSFDVWLVDNLPGPGRSVRPERGDAMLRVGRLEAGGSQLKLQTQLQHEQLSDFRLDLVMVAPAGESPEDGAFLFGSPGLFQRLYYSAPHGQLVRLGGDDYQAKGDVLDAVSIPFRTLIPRPAYAAESGPSALANLVKTGEQLFFQETFKGNGRTCGTCHPAERQTKDGVEWRWSAGGRLPALVCHRRGHATFYTDTQTGSGLGLRPAHRCPARRHGSIPTIAGPKPGIELAVGLQAAPP